MKSELPALGPLRRHRIEHWTDHLELLRRQPGRKIVAGKEAGVENLLRLDVERSASDAREVRNVDMAHPRDMGRDMVHDVDLQPCFLAQFTSKCGIERFSPFHEPARQFPGVALAKAVPEEQEFVAIVEHDAGHANRECCLRQPGETPPHRDGQAHCDAYNLKSQPGKQAQRPSLQEPRRPRSRPNSDELFSSVGATCTSGVSSSTRAGFSQSSRSAVSASVNCVMRSCNAASERFGPG